MWVNIILNVHFQWGKTLDTVPLIVKSCQVYLPPWCYLSVGLDLALFSGKKNSTFILLDCIFPHISQVITWLLSNSRPDFCWLIKWFPYSHSLNQWSAKEIFRHFVIFKSMRSAAQHCSFPFAYFSSLFVQLFSLVALPSSKDCHTCVNIFFINIMQRL